MSTPSDEPLISVIMPIYNADQFLEISVQSLIDQNYKNLEIILIDDGSTDKSASIIQNLIKRDARIQGFKQGNLGIASALNRGIAEAKGEFIARMDADDISFQHRLEVQLNYLRKNQNIDVLSAGYIPFRESPEPKQLPILHPPLNSQIYALLAFCSPFCHPCVLAKRQVFLSFPYRVGAVAEDHDLWCRAIKKFHFANLEEPLLYYRRHQSSATILKKTRIRYAVAGIGLGHILSDRQKYITYAKSIVGLDRSKYGTINWKSFDRINRILKVFE